MCGDAVIDVKSQQCVGLIEGIVPPFPCVENNDNPSQWFHKTLENHVGFLAVPILQAFVNNLGDGMPTSTAISNLF